MTQPEMQPEIAALGTSICQRLGYDWILRSIKRNGGVEGKSVLDFGPNGYPFIGLLAKMGATAACWTDRSPAVAARMLHVERRFGVELREVLLAVPCTYDVIVASNAIQHNVTGADEIYATLAARLADGGALYVVEALTHGKDKWMEQRADPHWSRTLASHGALWAGAGLRREAAAFFDYNYHANTGRWTELRGASRVVALLRRELGDAEGADK